MKYCASAFVDDASRQIRLQRETASIGSPEDRAGWMAAVLRSFRNMGAEVVGDLALITGIKRPLLQPAVGYAELRAELSKAVHLPPELGDLVATDATAGLSPVDLFKFDVLDSLYRQHGAEIAINTQTRGGHSSVGIELEISQALCDCGFTIMLAASERRKDVQATFVVKSINNGPCSADRFKILYERLSCIMASFSDGTHLAHAWIDTLCVDPEDHQRILPIL